MCFKAQKQPLLCFMSSKYKKSTGNFIQKATIVLAIFFMFFSFARPVEHSQTSLSGVIFYI